MYSFTTLSFHPKCFTVNCFEKLEANEQDVVRQLDQRSLERVKHWYLTSEAFDWKSNPLATRRSAEQIVNNQFHIDD